MSAGNLKDKTINGFQWGVIDNFANSGVAFLVGLILANHLDPVEFGTLAIVTIFTNFSITIVDGGFATALIRKIDSDDADYNTVFYSNLLFSVVLMAILVAIAPLVADFYSSEELRLVMIVMSSILCINAVSIIHKTLLIKTLDFKSQTIVSLTSSVVSGVAGIVAAYSGLGIWSLVIHLLARQSLLSAGLWLVSSWRPSLTFSTKSFKELFCFSSKVLLANVINTIFKDIFLLVVGKMYSKYELGLYNRADQFNQISSNNLGLIIQKVSLPVLSQLQNDTEQLREKFRKFSAYSAMLTFALCFGMAAAARPIVLMLVGEKWLPCVLYLQIMCFYGAIYPLQQLNLNILHVLKKSNYLLRLEIIKKFFFVLVIVVGFFFDLEYMIMAAVVYYYFEFFLNSWYSKRLMGYSSFRQIVDLSPFYFVSVFISAAVWPLSLLDWHPWLVLLVQVPLAFVLYNVCYSLLRVSAYVELRASVLAKINKMIHEG
ncbi:MAG: lipopolysaccharide biosynthesis protein [Bacteroidales bacterium]|nr:lipopolysaccharide biosynthesis protein [Bacteroidales bacterium]